MLDDIFVKDKMGDLRDIHRIIIIIIIGVGKKNCNPGRLDGNVSWVYELGPEDH